MCTKRRDPSVWSGFRVTRIPLGVQCRSRAFYPLTFRNRQTGDPRDVPAAHGGADSRQADALLRAPRWHDHGHRGRGAKYSKYLCAQIYLFRATSCSLRMKNTYPPLSLKYTSRLHGECHFHSFVINLEISSNFPREIKGGRIKILFYFIIIFFFFTLAFPPRYYLYYIREGFHIALTIRVIIVRSCYMNIWVKVRKYMRQLPLHYGDCADTAVTHF